MPIKAWVDGVQLEDEARAQLLNVARLPFIFRHIAVMPDVHWGRGATVGSVIPTKGAIIPAAVGVDIGCGMVAARTNLEASHLPDGLAGVRSSIEAAVPHGRTDNGGERDRGAWHDVPEHVEAMLEAGARLEYEGIVAKHPGVKHKSVLRHCGTLGTGNHFIELCLDEMQRVWIMLHSGSRGPGNKIGTYFIEKAKEDMRRHFINLPDADLAYIPEGSELFDDYWAALDWAQNYARLNREIMVANVVERLRRDHFPELAVAQYAINCHHNYVAWEHHYGENVLVTRKGAVRARATDLGIIPGSMGVASYIVRGRGNEDSFTSCSHGAGRAMSRRAARERFTVDDHALATQGVECRKDKEVLDETPGAYKDINAVMAAQSDLVEVVHTLKQVVCVKG
jgi:tRNA-splicing ligase RtcB